MMKTKTDRRVDRRRAKGRKGGRAKESKGMIRGGWKRDDKENARENRALAEDLRRKAPARFHGHRVCTPPLPQNTTGREEKVYIPFQRIRNPPFSHSISFCHCLFSAPWWAHSRRSSAAAFLAPFFSHSPFVDCRFAVFFSRAVYALACDAHEWRLDVRNVTARTRTYLHDLSSRSISISLWEYECRVHFLLREEFSVISLSDDVPFNRHYRSSRFCVHSHWD